MKPEEATTRIIGLAKIISYEVTFEKISYIISLKDCTWETENRVDHYDDYEISMAIPFTDEHTFLHWFRNPAFTAMQESWSNDENDCYFEHKVKDRAALMTLNGSVVLIPVANL